jgi:hypothetical protein
MNPNYLYDLARQQPLRSDIYDPEGVPQTLSGLIAMENARLYAPTQFKFTPEMARGFDQQAAQGQADLAKWADQVEKNRLERRNQQLKELEIAHSLQPKYELVQTEQGMFRIDPQSGKVIPVQPDNAGTPRPAQDATYFQPPQSAAAPSTAAPFGAKTKPMTEDQSKATGYGIRAATSHEILNTVGDSGKVQPGILKRIASSVPFYGEEAGTMMNWTQSPKQQQVEQAQRDFVNAILRRESGAVISQAEFDNAAKQYFPQPGDSQEVIKQKQLNRENSIRSLEIGSGAGAPQVQGARQKMQMIFEAQKAIKSGADKNAVRSRLEQMGIINHGL